MDCSIAGLLRKISSSGNDESIDRSRGCIIGPDKCSGAERKDRQLKGKTRAVRGRFFSTPDRADKLC